MGTDGVNESGKVNRKLSLPGVSSPQNKAAEAAKQPPAPPDSYVSAPSTEGTEAVKKATNPKLTLQANAITESAAKIIDAFFDSQTADEKRRKLDRLA